MADDNVVPFKMAPKPEDLGDTAIHRLFGDELRRAEALAGAFNRLEEVMHQPPEPTSVPELMFHTNKRRRMVFDRIPIGHDLGYRCYDGDKHDADSAFQSGEFGDGLSEDAAYVDWLHVTDEPKPRAGIIVNSSPTDPPEFISHNPTWREDDEE